MLQERGRGHGYATRDTKGMQQMTETVAMLQDKSRNCVHITRQDMPTGILQDMGKYCFYTRGNGKRLLAYYRRLAETAGILKELHRHCWHITGERQTQMAYYRIWGRDCWYTARAGHTLLAYQ